ncbi:MAG: hypothetical protein ACRCZF_04675 [Gemmataceae bacterium]
MTIAGAALLHRWMEASAPTQFRETYPRLVAAQMGFAGSYKQQPQACREQVEAELTRRGYQLEWDRRVRQFCDGYRTGAKQDDPDGADAFLALVAAMTAREAEAVVIGGGMPEEGAIVAPRERGDGPRIDNCEADSEQNEGSKKNHENGSHG